MENKYPNRKNKKIRVEEIDNEKVKNIKTLIDCDKDAPDIKLEYEGTVGLGYDGCDTHTHKD